MTVRAGVAACAAAFAVLAAAPAAACGPDSPCQVEGGQYLIRMPDAVAESGKVGAIVHFHGYRGHAGGVMANGSLGRQATDLGLALVAPDGAGRTWSFPGSPSRYRDEFAFVDAVMADLLQRFPIDPERVMATGFSQGGSMVWNLACHLPERFAGFAPVAGAFWTPLPDACASPGLPTLFHIHGTADRIVPLAGRAIRDIAKQGDVFDGVEVWLKPLAAPPAPVAFRDGRFDCRRWGATTSGGLELCLHGGGHEFRSEWIGRAWRKLARAKGWGG